MGGLDTAAGEKLTFLLGKLTNNNNGFSLISFIFRQTEAMDISSKVTSDSKGYFNLLLPTRAKYYLNHILRVFKGISNFYAFLNKR